MRACFAGLAIAFGTLAAECCPGQISYLSQARTVTAGPNSASAPDYARFNTSVSWFSEVGCAAGGQYGSASQDSQLDEDSIAFNLHTSGQSLSSLGLGLSVSFDVPAGTAYTWNGQRHVESLCCASSVVRLSGGGLMIDPMPHSPPFMTTLNSPYSFSGTLAGGSYTLIASAGQNGTCAGGFPSGATVSTTGTLRVTPPWCRTDVNGNHSIDPGDVALFVGTWTTSLIQGSLAGDFDGDSVVNPADVAVFVQAWLRALVVGPC